MPTESIATVDSETSSGTLRNDTTQSDSTKWQERMNYLSDLLDSLTKEGIQNRGQLEAKLADAIKQYNLTL